MSGHIGGSCYGSSPPDVRLILLGNIGCGKTSSADTILGQQTPVSPSDSRSCQLRRGVSEGVDVTLVEAPRWYWAGGKLVDSVREETERALTLVAPGPHAILLLVPVGLLTEMEAHVPAEVEEVFGKEALDHTLVLLTCGDYLMGQKVEEYLQGENSGLRQIIDSCGGRYHVINNRRRQDREQVLELLEKVDSMVKTNGVYSVKTAQDRELEKRMEARYQKLQENYRAQLEEMERKKETVASTHVPNTETQRSIDRVEEYSAPVESRGREERDAMDERVAVSQVSNCLHSSPAPEQQSRSELDDRHEERTSSFRLNAADHRTSSCEERSADATPASASHSPVFSSPPSSPTFASSPSPPPASPSSAPELRLVLLGRSGAGKSRAGNVILGRAEFESHSESLTAITKQCEKKKTLVEGRCVAVVDTPDWFNSEQTPDEVRAQISSCVTLASPGPHAFLLCVPLDQPAKTELQALGALETVFGPPAVQRHTLVLFTYADQLRESGKAGNDSAEAYIAGQRGDLLKLVEKCVDRFHVMETGGGETERRNVAELLEKVEQMVSEAGGQCYSCPAFLEAEDRVRQRQVEIARERKEKILERQQAIRQPSSERRVLYPYLQPVAEVEEEVREDEIEDARDEAEMNIRTMNIESLPPVMLSTTSPSLLRSIMETMHSTVGTAWGTVGSGAQNVQKMVVDSSVWGKMGAGAGRVSKLVGDRIPKIVVDSNAWVGSGAKAAAASPMWGRMGSGAKLVADGSMHVGAGIGGGAKNLAQSPMWGKVGSGAVTGAKRVAETSMRVGAGIGGGAKNLAQSPMWGKVGSGTVTGAKRVAETSMRVGAGIGASAKKVAQNPVWGKLGSGAKSGAKMVSESSVWKKIGTTAKKVPAVVILGALLGLVLGVVLGGAIGGAVGTAAGSAASEVGRRKFSQKNKLETANEDAKNAEMTVKDNVDSLVKQGEKVLKTE